MHLFVILVIVLFIFLALSTIAILLLRQKSQLIFGKYPRKGLFYIIKYGIALLVLKYLRKKFYNINEENEITIMDLDRPQKLSDDPKSYDVVSFMAANKDGSKLMITLERRRRGIIKSCLYLWLPNKGLLCSPKLPDMMYFTTNGTDENEEFLGCGLHIKPIVAMKCWQINYEGQLKHILNMSKHSEDNDQLEQLIPVKLNLKFTATSTAYFNYNRDLSPSVIADSTARESWNDDFYNMIKNVDKMLDKRMHYEQNGTLNGSIKIGSVEAANSTATIQTVAITMQGFRDHSFGTERCLSTINRYVYFALFLNDGTSMVIGNLSQPQFFLSSLKVGYICTKDGTYKPITKCNFELYSYGEKGIPSNNQNFIVHTSDSKYFVQIQVENTSVRYSGRNWESKIYNQFVTCTVNGVYGHGLTEYLYRNNTGRPHSISSNDPEWYQRIQHFERTLSTCSDVDTEEFIF